MGDTHEETDVLPIGNREECGRQVNHRYRQLKTRQALIGKELDSGDFPILIDKGGKMRRLWTRLRTADLGLLVQNGTVLILQRYVHGPSRWNIMECRRMS